MAHKLIKTDNYLLVVDDSLTIGKGYALNTSYKLLLKYNTDQHLAYSNDIVKKIIAHLPLNGSPILEGVDLLPPLEEDIEQFAKEWYDTEVFSSSHIADINSFKEGYNKAREKYKYTEEDMIQCWNTASIDKHQVFGDQIGGYFKQYIQSLHQYPTEFECEMIPCNPIKYTLEDHLDVEPKTITTAQGIQWVGKYK